MFPLGSLDHTMKKKKDQNSRILSISYTMQVSSAMVEQWQRDREAGVTLQCKRCGENFYELMNCGNLGCFQHASKRLDLQNRYICCNAEAHLPFAGCQRADHSEVSASTIYTARDDRMVPFHLKKVIRPDELAVLEILVSGMQANVRIARSIPKTDRNRRE